jgi:hypothetical protein
MTRRVVFDRPGMAQERPQEPRRRQPEPHRCQARGCMRWAFYGLRGPGVAAMHTSSTWWCKDHLPETVNS